VDNLFNHRPDYYYYNAPLTTGTNFLVGLSLDIDRLCSKR
jgi:outer membrane receptor for ferrienterochelin and colicins